MMTLDEKYIWTHHAQGKMRHYRLTESRIKRVIRYPSRIEESIVAGAVACMQPAEGKQYSEIWVMYVLLNAKHKEKKINPALSPQDITPHGRDITRSIHPCAKSAGYSGKSGIKQIKIITAWRYPGKSPERDPVPAEILCEIRNLVHNF